MVEYTQICIQFIITHCVIFWNCIYLANELIVYNGAIFNFSDV